MYASRTPRRHLNNMHTYVEFSLAGTANVDATNGLTTQEMIAEFYGGRKFTETRLAAIECS